MPRKAIVVLALTCALLGQAAAADKDVEKLLINLFRFQDQLGSRPSNQKIIKDPAEYNAYIKALNTMDAKQRAAAMEAFIAQYPDSVVIDDALELLLAAYQATGDEQKKEETAKRILGRIHGIPQAVPRPEFAQPMTPVRTPRTIADLASLYHDKVLALRHSFKSGSQEYEADGTPVKAGEEGSWTLYGCMLVKKISVEGDRLKVEGKRPVYGLDRSGSLVRFQNDRKHPAENLKVAVLLKQPLSSADEAAALLGRVFALTPEEMVNSVPSYWQSQVAKLLVSGFRKRRTLKMMPTRQEHLETREMTRFLNSPTWRTGSTLLHHGSCINTSLSFRKRPATGSTTVSLA